MTLPRNLGSDFQALGHMITLYICVLSLYHFKGELQILTEENSSNMHVILPPILVPTSLKIFQTLRTVSESCFEPVPNLSKALYSGLINKIVEGSPTREMHHNNWGLITQESSLLGWLCP